MSSTTPRFLRIRLVVTCASLLAGAIGAVSLLGWALDVDQLKGLGGAVTMKANAALGMCLLSLATLALREPPLSRNRQRAVRLAGALVTALGAVNLSQHLFGWNAGIDELLFHEAAGAVATASPGRMGPPASISFMLLGGAVLLLDRPARLVRSLPPWLVLAALPLPALAIIGYVTGATQLYGVARFTGIAPHTAIAFASLIFALLLVRPELKPTALLVAPDPGGSVARSMLPVAIVLPLLLTRLRLAAEQQRLFDPPFGRALTLLALIVTFSVIIWRTAQRLSAEAAERQRLETQRVALLESERAARHDAERAAKLKDDFLATLSHELRTPLNAILGWTTILKRMQSRPPELERPLQVIERSALAQTQLIEDLLDISSIVSGKLRLQHDSVDLAAVAQAALQAVQPLAETKQIKVEVELPAALPTVVGDATRLQQVLWNLLSNAIKFTPQAGKVALSAKAEGHQLTLRISDSGAGIAAEFLPHVFDRFRQADSGISRTHGGLGLGLSIVRQLVELHGGAVSASSPGPGRGSTFSICLPIAARTDLARAAEAPALTDSVLSGLTILVIDDDADNRDLMQRALTESGARVRLAASADEALFELDREPADVLISDIGMPGKDGYDLIRAVRARHSAVAMPAIAVTAFARPEDRTRALAAGFQLHVTKPINVSALLLALTQLTARRAPASSSPDAEPVADEQPLAVPT